MKILQIMAGAGRGGAETAFVDMCLALKARGEIIEVLTRANDLRVPQLEKAGITVHTARFGGKPDIFTKRKIKKVIREFQPEIVQTWMSRACHHTPAWSPGMKAPRYSVVARLGSYYKIKYFKSADYFVAITPYIRDYLIKNGVAPDHVRHINNFAEVEQVSTPVRRADHDAPEGAPLLLALSRLHPVKGLDMLIRAVAAVPGVYLWIAGEGPLRGEFEQLITQLNLQARVKLLGWRSDRGALLAACDICIFPSRYEPFGTVFVQAWAAGRPVVASMADGPKQFIRPGEDGLLFPIDDVTALAESINLLINNNNLKKNLVENGQKRYESEFTCEKTTAAYLDFYREIMA
ncbi:MAG: glycosyltransferase [Alphaproteobacteria bacterium]